LAQNLLDIDARRALFSHLDAFTIRSRPATMFFGSHSACLPSLGNFCARGAPKFREFCNYFARVLREGLRDFGASLVHFFISTHFQLAKEMQRRSAVCATYTGRVHANFVRAVRRNSGNFEILSRDFANKFAQNLRDLDAGRARVRMSTPSWLGEELWSCHASFSARRPSARNYLRAPRRNFRKFCNSFARFWRNLCVISTPNARLFGSERIFDSIQLQRRFSACVALAGRVHAIFARAARRISLKKNNNSSREFGAKFAWHRRQARTFFAFGCLYDSVKSCSDVV